MNVQYIHLFTLREQDINLLYINIVNRKIYPVLSLKHTYQLKPQLMKTTPAEGGQFKSAETGQITRFFYYRCFSLEQNQIRRLGDCPKPYPEYCYYCPTARKKRI